MDNHKFEEGTPVGGILLSMGLAATGSRTLAVLVITMVTGCFGPSFSPCTIQCGSGGACPPGLSCSADGFCHGPDEVTACNPADDGSIRDSAPIDSPWDGAIGPGDGGVDAFMSSADAGPPMSAGDLIITEIQKDPCAENFMGNCTLSDNDGEWFEVFNATGQALQLEQLLVNDTGGESFVVTQPVIINSGAYFVFGLNADDEVNGGVTVDYEYAPTLQLGNGDDEVRLYVGATLIDQVEYTTAAFPDEEGRALSLDPAHLDALENDTGGFWCSASTSYGDGDFGSPGIANPTCQ